MKIIDQSLEIKTLIQGEVLLKEIERIGKKCYQNEPGTMDMSARNFVKKLIEKDHTSVIEHFSFGVDLVTSRGAIQQLTRHRIASYTQESARYCNYKEGITFVRPSTLTEENEEGWKEWIKSCERCEKSYEKMRKSGLPLDICKGALNQDTKANIYFTMNHRSARNFLKLRSDSHAHFQIREIALMMLGQFKVMFPILYDDLYENSKK